MRDILLKLFGTLTGDAQITWLSVWHILYAVLIFGGTCAAVLLLRRASDKAKTQTLRTLAYLVPSLYIADFFIMPLAHADFTIDVGKLPFHLCTFLGFFVAFAQFNTHFSKIADAIVCITIAASFMYIIYPGTAIGPLLPWCYRVLQTFLYHGTMFAWSVLSVTTGTVKLSFKTLPKAAVGIVIAVLWALFGNAVYSREGALYDWYMVTGRSVPFIPAEWMPLVVFAVTFLACAVIVLIDHTVKKRCKIE